MDSQENNNNSIKVSNSLQRLIATTGPASTKDMAMTNYVLEKSLRIASAVHIVTDIIDSNESLCDELERTSIGLVRDASLSATTIKSRQQVLDDLLTLAGLMETAAIASLLSKKTAEVLMNEMVLLAEFVQELGWQRGRAVLSNTPFDVEVSKAVFAPDTRMPASKPSLGHFKDSPGGVDSRVSQAENSHAQRTAPDTTRQGKGQYHERVQGAQKDRRATILGLLQRKDRITVRDVAGVIKDCSEKTLQRELLALVAQGVLKKEGERRWSSYRLA